jgi:hypothetical protein
MDMTIFLIAFAMAFPAGAAAVRLLAEPKRRPHDRSKGRRGITPAWRLRTADRAGRSG